MIQYIRSNCLIRIRQRTVSLPNWQKRQGRIVITSDIDFLESFRIKSEPKKLITIRTGNIPNRQLTGIFDKNLEIIMQMISRSDLLEISRTEIEEHGS